MSDQASAAGQGIEHGFIQGLFLVIMHVTESLMTLYLFVSEINCMFKTPGQLTGNLCSLLMYPKETMGKGCSDSGSESSTLAVNI